MAADHKWINDLVTSKVKARDEAKRKEEMAARERAALVDKNDAWFMEVVRLLQPAVDMYNGRFSDDKHTVKVKLDPARTGETRHWRASAATFAGGQVGIHCAANLVSGRVEVQHSVLDPSGRPLGGSRKIVTFDMVDGGTGDLQLEFDGRGYRKENADKLVERILRPLIESIWD